MKIVHAGDLHVWKMGVPIHDSLALKRWLGGANLFLHRAKKFPPAYRRLGLKAIEAENPDVVIFTGDFSQASQTKEFLECSELFAPLREKLGDRLIAIPGNHDVYTSGSVKRKLLENGLPWVRTQPVSRIDLDGDLSVVTVNHSKPFITRSNGVVLPETHEFLRKTLFQCREENRVVLLAGHYPYATPPEHPETPQHNLIGEEMLEELVAEFAPSLYLHGHKHVRWAIRPEGTPDTLCLNCGSLGMKSDDPIKQAGFLSWEQNNDGTIDQLTAHHLTSQAGWEKTPLGITSISI